jgi:ABC-type antimicrobial peptide transport system permease subunit
MKQLCKYLQSAWYNILHNKLYAALSIVGAAVTFMFISIVVQFAYLIKSDAPPFTNGSRVIHLNAIFNDQKGGFMAGFKAEEASLFAANIKGVEAYAIRSMSYGNAWINGQMASFVAAFVDDSYWKINRFDFIEGRAFTREECEKKSHVAVIKESVAKDYFSRRNVVGQNFEFQNATYTVIGVVADYSSFVNDNFDAVWLPSQLNKFINSIRTYDVYLLLDKEIPLEIAKQRVSAALIAHYSAKKRKIDVAPEKIYTIQDEKLQRLGNMLSYGIPVTLFLLFIIPALNIITLNMENTSGKASEIAIRKAMGAGMLSSFAHVMVENLMLALMGAATGLALSYPAIGFVSKLLYEDSLTDGIFMSGLNWGMIIGAIFPLSLLYTLLCSGVPGYLISKKNIVENLKEKGSK